jgi:hypothetical protein
LKDTSRLLADSGYQGVQKVHANSELPLKASKNKPLTKDDKRKNRKQSSARVAVENIIRDVKIFRIIAEKYRNRRKRFGLRFNLIAAI